MVVLVGDPHQVGKIPFLIKGILIVIPIGNDLVNAGLQIQILQIQGAAVAGI